MFIFGTNLAFRVLRQMENNICLRKNSIPYPRIA